METILEVNNLKKHFPVERGAFKKTVGYVHAVDGISFFIRKGEVLGLVGESGCGKTTTGKIIVGLLKPTSGEVLFCGQDIFKMGRTNLASKIQIIFQDPFASLNPRLSIGTILGEAVKIRAKAENKQIDATELKEKVKRLLDSVGLPANIVNDYPHQFSGGQRQRIGIARALAMEPEIIIADEPVSSLDISIQAQILNLLSDLKDNLGLSYLFIAHDLNVTKHITDRIIIMHNGRIMEEGVTNEVYQAPKHDYTKKLLSSVPVVPYRQTLDFRPQTPKRPT